MTQSNTITSKMLKPVPGHELKVLANTHQNGQMFRMAPSRFQIVTIPLGQLPGLRSLQDVVESISTRQQRFYHLGTAKLSRSGLS